MSLTPGGDGGENVVGYILANRSAVASPAALVQTAKQQNKRGGQQSKHVDTQGYVFLHIILVYFVSAIQEPTVPSILFFALQISSCAFGVDRCQENFKYILVGHKKLCASQGQKKKGHTKKKEGGRATICRETFALCIAASAVWPSSCSLYNFLQFFFTIARIK